MQKKKKAMDCNKIRGQASLFLGVFLLVNLASHCGPTVVVVKPPLICPSSGKVGTSISGCDQRDGTLVGEDGRGGSLHNDRCNWPPIWLFRVATLFGNYEKILFYYIYIYNLKFFFFL
ncbi:hypothetical protein NC652_041608 [Populus alba x Populus x berolinensis]|nr:hypothetical protein NC652_041608 [Populus alba x Populus x berolinensis]